jgi:hypothetical protein
MQFREITAAFSEKDTKENFIFGEEAEFHHFKLRITQIKSTLSKARQSL